jgi:tRNA(fMet)-specific endonuclease VapC
MRYLLDTNVCISYLNKEDSLVRVRMQMLKPTEIVLCSIVQSEIYYGVMRSAAPTKNLARLTAKTLSSQRIQMVNKYNVVTF